MKHDSKLTQIVVGVRNVFYKGPLSAKTKLDGKMVMLTPTQFKHNTAIKQTHHLET
jgi:hypothetical protein